MARALKTEIRRFLIVGSTTVAIDLICYSALLRAGVPVPMAKAIGFVAGMIFAWFANRFYTFAQKGGFGRMTGFVVLYLGTLGLNVLTNQLWLSLLGPSTFGYFGAFLVATGLSATANFLGMKLLVFRPTS
jgi:putative flippase GtrA